VHKGVSGRKYREVIYSDPWHIHLFPLGLEGQGRILKLTVEL